MPSKSKATSKPAKNHEDEDDVLSEEDVQITKKTKPVPPKKGKPTKDDSDEDNDSNSEDDNPVKKIKLL